MRGLIFFNGELVPADTKLAGASNRGLRYGEGVFETIRIVNGKIPLLSHHFDRLSHGLQTLQLEIPAGLSPAYLSEAILLLCRKNNMESSARTRLTIFRGEERESCLVIESMPIPDGYDQFNEKGWTIDIYKEIKKSCDILSNLKSNNYLPYTIAAAYAKSQALNDCLLLNSYERICDSTIANIFWIKDKQVFTPPLSEGCIAGVMRRYLVEKIHGAGLPLEEKICTRQKLQDADEIFLTNALFGIRWVQQLADKTYINKMSLQFYKQFIKTLFPS
jgi:branched-chain amino acid aminotransferase